MRKKDNLIPCSFFVNSVNRKSFQRNEEKQCSFPRPPFVAFRLCWFLLWQPRRIGSLAREVLQHRPRQSVLPRSCIIPWLSIIRLDHQTSTKYSVLLFHCLINHVYANQAEFSVLEIPLRIPTSCIRMQV